MSVPPVAPADPYANKSLVAALTIVGGVVTQWLSTGEFNLEQEGVTSIVGAVVTILVYAVSNRKKLLG